MFQEFKINNLEQFPQDLDALLNQQRAIICVGGGGISQINPPLPVDWPP